MFIHVIGYLLQQMDQESKQTKSYTSKLKNKVCCGCPHPLQKFSIVDVHIRNTIFLQNIF